MITNLTSLDNLTGYGLMADPAGLLIFLKILLTENHIIHGVVGSFYSFTTLGTIL